MGCDIHLHTEVKINGKWHHYGCPNIMRSYRLFAMLAGVRNYDDIEPIAQPRGLPVDATELTKLDCEHWDADGHSHSWIGSSEILRVCEYMNEIAKPERAWMNWEDETIGYLFGNTWRGFEKCPEYRPNGVQDIRWVFWFDN